MSRIRDRFVAQSPAGGLSRENEFTVPLLTYAQVQYISSLALISNPIADPATADPATLAAHSMHAKPDATANFQHPISYGLCGTRTCSGKKNKKLYDAKHVGGYIDFTQS